MYFIIFWGVRNQFNYFCKGFFIYLFSFDLNLEENQNSFLTAEIFSKQTLNQL